MKQYIFGLVLFIIACKSDPNLNVGSPSKAINLNDSIPFLVVLGTTQDAGSPQVACNKKCCKNLFGKPNHDRKVTSLGLVDPLNGESFLFEATPNFVQQLHILDSFLSHVDKPIPDGIFITHAHIGHYSGLMYLGKESCSSKDLNTYVMPRMHRFLSNNGPWSQLVNGKNIKLNEITENDTVDLGRIKVIPLIVPHRDEYSETVGFKIIGPHKSAIFIPDIDKWNRWENDIRQIVMEVDIAFLDATFFHSAELENRDMSLIPHPFVEETMSIFDTLDVGIRNKINFIHFNHTNPLLDSSSQEYKELISKGYRVARINQKHSI